MEKYDLIAQKVSCPEFRNPIKNFIDDNCSSFIDIDENSFEQMQIFKEINLLIENLLQKILLEGNITNEEFLKAAERGTEDPKYKKYFNQLIHFGNYEFFKSVMIKRNYQLIKMAEIQMGRDSTKIENKIISQPNNSENKENKEKRETTEKNEKNDKNDKNDKNEKNEKNEENELNEAIKQSLRDEDEQRRLKVIEEEELRRAIKRSLLAEQKARKSNTLQKEETKKEEPKKEEPKKVPLNFITSNQNFQIQGKEKPKEDNQTPKILPKENKNNQNIELKISSKTEDFGLMGEPKKQIDSSYMMFPPTKKPEDDKNSEKKETINNPEKEVAKKELNVNNEENKNNENNNEHKNEETVGKDFVNIFEEKKLTLAPLINKSINIIMENPYRKEQKVATLKNDLEKYQKPNVQKDIERIKNQEAKYESPTQVVKNTLETENNINNNFISNFDKEDFMGLLLDEEDEPKNEDKMVEKKEDSSISKNNINLGKISIPSNFKDKIPEYDKNKQEELKKYREMIIKQTKENREAQLKIGQKDE